MFQCIFGEKTELFANSAKICMKPKANLHLAKAAGICSPTGSVPKWDHFLLQTQNGQQDNHDSMTATGNYLRCFIPFIYLHAQNGVRIGIFYLVYICL